MLEIRQQLVEAIVAHAGAEHPLEACGVVVGPDADHPERFVPMINVAQSETFYEVESRDLIRLYQDLDRTGQVLSVIFHSHPSSQARPSRTDVELAAEPFVHYVVVSPTEFRSFRIVDGEVMEEEVRVLPAHGSDRPTLGSP